MSESAHEMDSAWSEAWRSSPAVDPPSLGKIRRRHLGYLAWVGGQWLCGIAFVVLVTGWAIDDLRPTSLVAAVVVACLVAASLIFDAWNRRGTFVAADHSARAWLELADRRLRAELRALRFGWALLAAEVLFFLPWLAWGLGERGAPAVDYLEAYGFLAALVVVASLAISWAHRRWRRQLAAVREQLAGYEAP